MIKITAKDIDILRSKAVNLNQMEKIAIRKIMGTAEPDICFIDCIDIKPERFKSEIESFSEDLTVITEHKAEDKYAVVAAASIVAKVERDSEIDKIRKNFQMWDQVTPAILKPLNS